MMKPYSSVTAIQWLGFLVVLMNEGSIVHSNTESVNVRLNPVNSIAIHHQYEDPIHNAGTSFEPPRKLDTEDYSQARIQDFEQFIHTHDKEIMQEDEQAKTNNLATDKYTTSSQEAAIAPTDVESEPIVAETYTTDISQQVVDSAANDENQFVEASVNHGQPTKAPSAVFNVTESPTPSKVVSYPTLTPIRLNVATLDPTIISRESSNIMKHKFPKVTEKKIPPKVPGEDNGEDPRAPLNIMLHKFKKAFKVKYLKKKIKKWYDGEEDKKHDNVKVKDKFGKTKKQIKSTDSPIPPLPPKDVLPKGSKGKLSKDKKSKFIPPPPGKNDGKAKEPKGSDFPSSSPTKYSMDDEHTDDDENVITRVLPLAAFKYQLVSGVSTAITESDYGQLLNVTHLIFDKVFSDFFKNVNDVSYIKTHVKAYEVLQPLLVKFDVAVQFSPNSTSIPSTDQLAVIAQEAFDDDDDNAKKQYLALLTGILGTPFATTSSVRYLNTEDEVKDAETTISAQGGGGGASGNAGQNSSMKVVVPIASMALLFVVVTALCMRRQNQVQAKSTEEIDAMNGKMSNKNYDLETGSVESTHLSDYRTSVFSDDRDLTIRRLPSSPIESLQTEDSRLEDTPDFHEVSLNESSYSNPPSDDDDDTTNVSQLTGCTEFLPDLTNSSSTKVISVKHDEIENPIDRPRKWSTPLALRSLNRNRAPATITEDDEASDVSSDDDQTEDVDETTRSCPTAASVPISVSFKKNSSIAEETSSLVARSISTKDQELCSVPVPLPVSISIAVKPSPKNESDECTVKPSSIKFKEKLGNAITESKEVDLNGSNHSKAPVPRSNALALKVREFPPAKSVNDIVTPVRSSKPASLKAVTPGNSDVPLKKDKEILVENIQNKPSSEVSRPAALRPTSYTIKTLPVDSSKQSQEPEVKPVWMTKKLRPVPEPKSDTESVASLAKKFEKPAAEAKKIEKPKPKPTQPKKSDSTAGKQPEWAMKSLRPTGIEIVTTTANKSLLPKTVEKAKTGMSSAEEMKETKPFGGDLISELKSFHHEKATKNKPTESAATSTDKSPGMEQEQPFSDQNSFRLESMTKPNVVLKIDTPSSVCESNYSDVANRSAGSPSTVSLPTEGEVSKEFFSAQEIQNKEAKQIPTLSVTLPSNILKESDGSKDMVSKEDTDLHDKLHEAIKACFNEVSQSEFKEGKIVWDNSIMKSSEVPENQKMIRLVEDRHNNTGNEVRTNDKTDVGTNDRETTRSSATENDPTDLVIVSPASTYLVPNRDHVTPVITASNNKSLTASLDSSTITAPVIKGSHPQCNDIAPEKIASENQHSSLTSSIQSKSEVEQSTIESPSDRKVPSIQANIQPTVEKTQSFALNEGESAQSPSEIKTRDVKTDNIPQSTSRASTKATPAWMKKIPPSISSQIPQQKLNVNATSTDEKGTVTDSSSSGNGLFKPLASPPSSGNNSAPKNIEKASTSQPATPEWMKKFKEMGLQKEVKESS